MFGKVHLSKEPVAWFVAIIAILQTTVKLMQGASLQEVLNQDWVDYVLLAVGGLFIRQTVYAPATIEKLTTPRISDEPNGDVGERTPE